MRRLQPQCPPVGRRPALLLATTLLASPGVRARERAARARRRARQPTADTARRAADADSPATRCASAARRRVALPSPGVAEAEPSPSPRRRRGLARPRRRRSSPRRRSCARSCPAPTATSPAARRSTLSAVLVGRGADLASASLAVNGADAGAQIDKRSPREWTIHASQSSATGTHTVRVLVRDASGALGRVHLADSVGGEPESRQPPRRPAPAARPPRRPNDEPARGVGVPGRRRARPGRGAAPGAGRPAGHADRTRAAARRAGRRLSPSARATSKSSITTSSAPTRRSSRFIRELGLEDRLIWGQPNTSTLVQRSHRQPGRHSRPAAPAAARRRSIAAAS